VTLARYFGEIERRRRLLDAAGVPRCEWIATHVDYDSAPDAPAVERMHDEAQAHAAICPVCKARRDYAEAHFGPRPSFPRWWRVGSITAFPPWVIPAVVGAIGVGGATALRVIIAVFGPSRIRFAIAIATVGLAILAGGAVGGFVYRMAGALLSKRGGLRHYVTGVVLWAGYVGAFLAMFALWPGQLPTLGPREGIELVGLTVAIGLAGGHAWRRIFLLPS
jgi:hypothetical protein